jgi:hypothetical protein
MICVFDREIYEIYPSAVQDIDGTQQQNAQRRKQRGKK